MPNFVIIGDGGIGSNLAIPLLKIIAYHKNKGTIKDNVTIMICDGDVVEPKNAIRQHFYPEDKGKMKTDITSAIVKNMAMRISKGIEIVSFPHYVKPDNIKSVIKEGDIVLVGVDNYITRKLIEDHTQKMQEVFVTFGGNDYFDGDVNNLIKEKGKYLTPLLTEKHPEVAERKEKYPDEISCEEAIPSAPQLIIANFSAAVYMLEAVNSYITEKEVKWHEKFFDNESGAVRVINIKEDVPFY